MQSVGVILAAGASSRMGSHKAVLKLGQQSFVQLILNAFSSLDVILIVASKESSRQLDCLPSQVNVIINPDPDRGMFSSVQEGLAAAKCAKRVLLTPVDCPVFTQNTVKQLVAFHQQHQGTVIPTYAGKPGHPVLLDPKMVSKIVGASSDDRLDRLLETSSAGIHFLPLDDHGILVDTDTPEDLAQLEARFGPTKSDDSNSPMRKN